jgi:hypothetical protein
MRRSSRKITARSKTRFGRFSEHFSRRLRESALPRQKVSLDLSRIADADLNVVEFPEPGTFVKRLPFQKKAPHRIKSRFSSLRPERVKRLNHRAVQGSGLSFNTGILGGSSLAPEAVNSVSLLHQIQGLGVDQIQASTKINDRPEDCGLADTVRARFHFFDGPAPRAIRAVLPKVDPVPEPFVNRLAFKKIGFPADNAPRQIRVTTVVTENNRPRKHQGLLRWGRASSPHALRTASKNFLAFVFEAASSLANARISLTSVRISAAESELMVVIGDMKKESPETSSLANSFLPLATNA